MLVLAAIILGLLLGALYGQSPIGPIVGPGDNTSGTVTSFSFTNGSELTGVVNSQSTTPTLSLSLNANSIVAGKIHFSQSLRILGRNVVGAGAAQEMMITDVLDWLGGNNGAILYRDSLIGWTVLPPTAGYLRSAGLNTNPFWQAEDNEKSANKGAVNGYAPLDGSQKVPLTNLPSFELQVNRGAVNGYAPLDVNQRVPIALLGAGSTGDGLQFLADDGVFRSVSGVNGGTVTSITLTMPTEFSVANPTITSSGTHGVTWANAPAYSWFGNRTGSPATPIMNTVALPNQLLPGFSGNVTAPPGSNVLTITDNAVTYAKIQLIASHALMGNPNVLTAAPTNVPVEGTSWSGSTLRLYAPAGSLSGTSPVADAATTKSFYITLSGITTFTFSGFNDGDSLVVRCQQAASGGPYTVVFPTATWQGGSQPAQTVTPSKSDIYQFHKQASTIYANAIQNF